MELILIISGLIILAIVTAFIISNSPDFKKFELTNRINFINEQLKRNDITNFDRITLIRERKRLLMKLEDLK